MSQVNYSVIDTETTGLWSTGHDRVAEIAIVTLSPEGEVIERWETLINPQRDLGKQSLHGIRAADVLSAPTFKDVADEIAWRLSGTVPVAHNLRFDAGFLTAEWHRAGTQFPLEFFEYGLCTMQEASVYLPGNNRNLADCCAAFDITIPHAHSAGDDAEATAQLLAAYMRTETNAEKWTRIFEASQSLQWTVTEPAARTICRLRSRSDAPQETHFLERIVQHIPEAGETAAEIDYLGLLDRALLDRHLSLHEQDALVALANELGLGRSRVVTLHDSYMDQLLAAAWDDGVITDSEEEDLRAVGQLLSVSREKIDSGITTRPVVQETSPSSKPSFGPGSSICLTGDMSKPRPQIAEELVEAGFVVKSGVSKKLDLLVAADPGSLSGKARKARDYGIPVVGEEYVWSHLLTRVNV